MRLTHTRRVVVVLASFGIGAALFAVVQPSAQAGQHGTNRCISQRVQVHRSANSRSAVIGTMSKTAVWHDYYRVGGWSLGYDRSRNQLLRGYIPANMLSRDLGNSSYARWCPRGEDSLRTAGRDTIGAPNHVPDHPVVLQHAGSLSMRRVCARNITVRIPGSNQPNGVLYRGEHFQVDHYSRNKAWALGRALGGENVLGQVLANELTDRPGRCRPQYDQFGRTAEKPAHSSGKPHHVRGSTVVLRNPALAKPRDPKVG